MEKFFQKYTKSSDSTVAISDLLSTKSEYIVNSAVSPNLFTLNNIENGNITIRINDDIYPGSKNFDIYFYNPKEQSADSKGTIPVTLTGYLTIDSSQEESAPFNISPDTIYIPVKKTTGGSGGVATVPGYNDYGTRDNTTSVANNYLKSSLNGYGLFDGTKTYNGGLYMAFTTTFVKGIQGISNSRGVLWSEPDRAVPKENYFLVLYSATGTDPTWTHSNISNEEGIAWTYTDSGASVDFSTWLSKNARFISNGGSISLVTVVPVTSSTDTVTYNGAVGWLGYDKWDGPTLKGMFSNPDDGSDTPYFRGSSSATIYNTDIYDVKNELQAFSGSDNITSSIVVTDYDGYPKDGVALSPGEYPIQYSVSNSSGEVSYFTRTITVLENKQSITGSDYTMHVGDKDATVADFNPSATDKEGHAVDVSADLSKIDFSKVGTYHVVLSSTDNQTKTVTLTIKENKQSIDGSDYTMHVGDKDATVADFNPSATDKDGNAIAVSADLVAIDFSKVGTYDVVLRATDRQTKTVQLTILAKEVVPTIEVTNKTMYVGDTLTKEEVLNWAIFINADGLIQGFEVVGTKIPVSADDKLITVGNYTIKYYVQGKGRAVSGNLAEKEIILTVLDKKADPIAQTAPAKTISPGTLSEGRTTASGKALPSTGEQTSTLFYIAGVSLMVATSSVYLWIRKLKRN